MNARTIFPTIALGLLIVCCTQSNKEILTYTNTEQGFSIAVPEGMIQSAEVQPDSFILRFRDKAPPADHMIMVEVINLAPQKRSLQDFSREVHAAYLSRTGPEGHETASGTTSLSGVPAQWFRMYATGRGQQAMMEHYVLVHDMRGYVISHFTLADHYDRDKVEAERIIQSFRLLADKYGLA